MPQTTVYRFEIVQDFLNWTKRKIKHHFDELYEKEVFFREKEIWWAALGKNIGFEIDGKHELFERPVLVLKKYNRNMCFVLPLTTQIKDTEQWYQFVIALEETISAVILSQGRTISSNRLLRRMVSIDSVIYNEIISNFVDNF